MTTTAALFGLLGAGLAVGSLLIVTGLRGRPARPATPSRLGTWLAEHHDRKQVGWLVGAVFAGLAVGVITGWVVGAILTVLAIVGLPRILGSNVDHKRHLERIEAIAGWTEMLRDTLVAAAGLEQAILATAPGCPGRDPRGDHRAGRPAGTRRTPRTRTAQPRRPAPRSDRGFGDLRARAGRRAPGPATGGSARRAGR